MSLKYYISEFEFLKNPKKPIQAYPNIIQKLAEVILRKILILP